MEGYKYFLYSAQYVRDRNNIENRVGRVFVNGTVWCNGSKKEYSLISDTPTLNRYSDIRIIAEGDVANIKFTEPALKPRKD